MLSNEFPKELRRMLWGTHLWSPSYCAVTCGGAPLEIVKAYFLDLRRPSARLGAVHSARLRKKQVPA